MKSRFAAAVLLIAACAWAQEPAGSAPAQGSGTPAQGSQDAPQTPAPAPAGSPTESQPQQPEYGGPVILSRGGSRLSLGGGELARIRPWASVSGIYDNGLATASITPEGTMPFVDAYGVEASFGVAGNHYWKRTTLGLDYRGSARHYSRSTYYDGIDNSLMLHVDHQATRKIAFSFGEMAARYTRSFFLPSGLTPGYDPTIQSVATNSLFDTPTSVLLSSAQMVYQQSTRLSFSMAGTGFMMRQHAAGLVGINGATAVGTVAYRLSRYQTIGVAYNFSHFGFQNQFGASDVHGISLDYSIQLGKRWQFSAGAGGYRVETQRIQVVQLDPAIAAILGQSTGVAAFHGVVYVPHYQATLTRGFQHALFTLSYSRTVVPGNGVFLTSSSDNGGIGVTYTGLHRVSMFTDASYSAYRGLAGQNLGTYRSYSAGAGLGYQLSRSFSARVRIDGRRFYIQGVNLNRIYYRATVGLAWSPGERPLSVW